MIGRRTEGEARTVVTTLGPSDGSLLSPMSSHQIFVNTCHDCINKKKSFSGFSDHKRHRLLCFSRILSPDRLFQIQEHPISGYSTI